MKGCADEKAVSKGVRENVDSERSVQHGRVERGYSVEEGYDEEDLRGEKALTEYVRKKGCNEEDVGAGTSRKSTACSAEGAGMARTGIASRGSRGGTRTRTAS